MKAYLLYEGQDFDFDAALPPNHGDLVQDLDLVIIFQAMAQRDRFLFEMAQRVVLASLDEPEAIVYRQQVLADCLAHPEIVRDLYAIAVGALEDKRGIWGYSSRIPTTILSGAIHQLEAFVLRLQQLRQLADEHLDKFQSRGLRTLLRTVQRELDDGYLGTIKQQLRQLQFRDGKLMSLELGPDNAGVRYVLRSSGTARGRWKERLGLGRRQSYSFAIHPRDEAGAAALSDMTNRGINLVANAAAQSADHITSYFTMLRAELGFYVGCLNLHDQLTSLGERTVFPEPVACGNGALSFTNLRDPCLALRSQEPVVGNDVSADRKSLLIVTGANSGGKSTFLRSVGLAQLMMQCGLFVAADAYRADLRTAVFTHFIREEDTTMESGRLDEELSRMSTIADQIDPHSLILFNESFAGTNEREGSEIGRQVVRALLEAEIRVFFVTHQFDFADSFQRQHADSTLFLRAPRAEDGRRSFKLEVAPPLSTSFGEDVYVRLGGWFEEDRLASVDATGPCQG